MNIRGLRKEIEELSDFSSLLKEFEESLSLGSDVLVTKIRSIFVSLNSIKDVIEMLDIISYNLGVIIIKKFKKEDDRVLKMLNKMKEDEVSFSSVKKELKSYFKCVSELEKLTKADVSGLRNYGLNIERIATLLEKDFEEVS